MQKMWTLLLIVLLSSPLFPQGGEANVPGPSFKDVLELKSIGSPVISPCGSHILFTVREVDWDKNGDDTEIWLSRDQGEPFQLTRTLDGSSSSPSWSPDGKWISFLASRGDKGQQIYLIRPDGGEAFKVTDFAEGINSYIWFPSAKSFVFSATNPQTDMLKSREKDYGRFEIEDGEYRLTHLWTVKIDINNPSEAKPLTSSEEFTVGSYDLSPDGTKIAFDHRPDPLINSSTKADISILDINSGEITPIVTQPGSDGNPEWSPDGKWIVFRTKMGDNRYFINSELARIPAQGGQIEILTKSFDENPNLIDWKKQGIYFSASERVFIRLYHLDPSTGKIEKLSGFPENISGISFADDGNTIAFSGYDRTTLREIYTTKIDHIKLKVLTHFTEEVSDWRLGTREVIIWKSKDGTPIEGILWKPADFDPKKTYPLLVNIHGGPTGTSRPVLVSGGVYPYVQWLSKGALILQPNYRGSAGYGESFRSLNVGNLGVGDMWDVESGVKYLIDQGIVNSDQVGAMGWSQGGYISAFLSTNSTMFKALSVGAGISNWVTYYVNTDIHPFTRHYLKATPWEDMEVYKKTSPMTNINKAQTPTLIQHGEFDRRVPIPNAYELYQGLQDIGVPVKLIVYKDFGHGISRPKEQLASQWHNWQWFAKYIWNEDVEIPIEQKSKK